MTTDAPYNFNSTDTAWVEGYGRMFVIKNPGGIPSPGAFKGQTVRIDGDEYLVRGVEMFRAWPEDHYPEDRPFSLLV